jgi:pilus assembly protein CpaE
MVERTVYILVVGAENAVHDEVASAVEALRRTGTVVLHARSLREGVEAARNRNPDLVILELGPKPAELMGFTKDIEHVSPETVVVGAYRVDPSSEGAGDGQSLVSAMRSNVKDFLRRPVSSNELQEVIDRHLGSHDTAPTGRQRHGVVVDFVSNKGGVGKSTVSVNTACLLAKRNPGRVLLIDASLQLGVCASSLDIQASTTIVDAVQELSRLDETLLREISVRHDSGLHVLAAPGDAVEATQVGETEISRVLSVARRAFDYVVVDTFPLVDAVAVAGLDLSNLVYCITSDTVPNVIGMARYVTVLERLGVARNRLRVVLNHPQPRFSGALTPADVAARLDHDINHVVPFDRKVLVGLNVGVPYSLRASNWYGFGRAIKGIADEIEALSTGENAESGAGGARSAGRQLVSREA